MVGTTRRRYLQALGSAGIVGATAGCLGSAEAGTLATRVTDQPGDIADFESCVITVVGTWLGPTATDTTDSDGETSTDRQYYEFDEPQQADLVQLQDGQTQLVDERELDAETYEFLQLDTDGVDATLEDGSSTTVDVPGEAPLTFNEQFSIRQDTRTTFTADFTPVRRGGTEGYLLQPVPDGITVEYQDEG